MNRFEYWLLFYMCIVCLLGCGNSKPDLVQSPQAPNLDIRVQIVRVEYQPATQSVSLEWSASDLSEIATIHVLKGFTDDSFFELVRQDVGQLSLSNQNTYTFQDDIIFAGERQFYKIELETKSGPKITSNVLGAILPGSNIERVAPDAIQAQIEIQWHPETDAVGYELIRQTDQGPEQVVYRTQNAQDVSFVDASLLGNVSYTYRVRTVMNSGIRLTSAGRATGFYMRSLTSQIPVAPESLIQLSLDWTKMASPLAVVLGAQNKGVALFDVVQEEGQPPLSPSTRYTRPEENVVYKFNRLGFVNLPQELNSLELTSLAFDGPSLQQRKPNLFVSGIDIESRQLSLYVFERAQDQIAQVNWRPELWNTSGGDGRTVISHGQFNRLFVGASGKLRLFNASLEMKGDVDLPFGQMPFDILGLAHTVWASFPDEGRLVRGVLQFDDNETLIDIAWQDIALPDNAKPLGLDVNAERQVMVLDPIMGEVLIYSDEGTLVSRILNIGATEDFMHSSGVLRGDLCSSIVTGPGAFVIDAHGVIRFFGDSTAHAAIFIPIN